MINPGKLRHYLTFQRPVVTSDGTGAGGTTTYSDAFNLWAERWNVSGQERVSAAKNREGTIYRWHLPTHKGIISSMRIKYINKNVTHYLEIIGINELENNDIEMEIISQEMD